MVTTGIVVIGENAGVQQAAKGRRVPVTVSATWELAYERTVFVAPNTKVPWDLLDAGFGLLDRWDVAVPLGVYGTLARDVGGHTERLATERRMRDLRMLLYEPGLLFAQQNETAQELLSTWRDECINGADERLAFVRAVYQVKPRLCALPRVWLMELPAAGATRQNRGRNRGRKRGRKSGSTLIRVEIAPGRYVRCNPADAEKVKEMYKSRVGRRRG